MIRRVPDSPPRYTGEIGYRDGQTYVALPAGTHGVLNWVPTGRPAPIPTVVKPPITPTYTGPSVDSFSPIHLVYPPVVGIDDDDLSDLAEKLVVCLVDYSNLAKDMLAKKLVKIVEEESWRPTYESEGEIARLKRENRKLTEQLREATKPLQAPSAPITWDTLRNE